MRIHAGSCGASSWLARRGASTPPRAQRRCRGSAAATHHAGRQYRSGTCSLLPVLYSAMAPAPHRQCWRRLLAGSLARRRSPGRHVAEFPALFSARRSLQVTLGLLIDAIQASEAGTCVVDGFPRVRLQVDSQLLAAKTELVAESTALGEVQSTKHGRRTSRRSVFLGRCQAGLARHAWLRPALAWRADVGKSRGLGASHRI